MTIIYTSASLGLIFRVSMHMFQTVEGYMESKKGYRCIRASLTVSVRQRRVSLLDPLS